MRFPEYDDGIWPLLTQVKRPSRYAGCEFGILPPREETEGIVRFCLAFPDVYEIGMSYLGFQILYYLIKKQEKGDADRVYCPWTDLEELLRSSGKPLVSLETSRPLKEFDVVGFTLQYELSYTNILTMLDLGGIPLLAEDRGEKDPLIAAGGPGALAPEPLAPFLDFLCIGDGEELVPEVISRLSAAKRLSRREKLEVLAGIEGVYVPSLVQWEDFGGAEGPLVTSRPGGCSLPVRRRIVPSLDDAFYPESLLVPSAGIVHDRVPMEIFRGCTRGCRFCQAGMTTRPVRERSAPVVVEKTLSLVERTGWEEVGLISLASCDYSGIADVIGKLSPVLAPKNVKVSLPSLRMDAFSVQLAAGMEAMKRGSLTFAPEAGTQRLRDAINKGVTDEDFRTCLGTAFSNGWEKIKLYFMMGLPTETYEDLDGIIELAELGLSLGKACKRRAQISVSVAGFVPKAHTPFQWEPQLSLEELRRRGSYLKGKLASRHGSKSSRLSLKYHEPEQTFLEGVFARGDRRLAPVLLEAWRKGARFDGWTETFSLPLWMDAFRTCSVDPLGYTARERARDEWLPWDHISAGISREFLWRERERAYEGLLSPDCRTLGNVKGAPCRGCGIQGCPIQSGEGKSQ